MTAEDLIAVDFETYYTSEYSLAKMSTRNYLDDPRFKAYLVAVYGEGLEFVGAPDTFDWTKIHGKIVCMHNASFDEAVFLKLKELGTIPATVSPARIVCTADLAAWLGVKRDLKTASKYLLDIEVSKTVRDTMKGHTLETAFQAGLTDELLKYGISDAKLCFELAKRYLAQWPMNEQQMSQTNREAGFRGVHINTELVETSIKDLQRQLFDTEQAIPWIDEGDRPLSPHAVRRQGRKEGIPVPASLAKDSPEVLEWEAKYADSHPWIRATRNYRSLNGQLKRVQAIKCNTFDGVMPYQIKYFGAGTTGRFSGGGESGEKFNMQNMPKSAMFGVDVRHMLIPASGHKFIIADYAQIEARILLWLAGDFELIRNIGQVGNIYKAFARKIWGRDIVKGTPDYALAKAMCLGLGYYCGSKRFRAMAAKPPYNIAISEEQASEAVSQYRTSNPKIVSYWAGHQTWLNVSAGQRDATHQVELRSGRVLTYYEPRRENNGEITVHYTRGEPRMTIHSGVLTNNVCQATARDILRDAWLNLNARSYPVRFSVHDELVIEIPEDRIDTAKAEIYTIMTTSSPWAAGCPIDVEIVVSDFYTK